MLTTTYLGAVWVTQAYFSDGWVRAFFKVLLLAVVIFIAIIGNWCLSLWIKKKLLSGKVVRLNETAGWIYGPSLAKAAFKFRQLPGGWLGWLMIVVTIFDLIGEYGVAITVKSQLLWTTEVFPSGGIVTTSNAAEVPSPYFGAAQWATAAQYNNYINSIRIRQGIPHYGIYRMITNDTTFMASRYDEIGYWACSQVNTSKPLIFDQAWKKANYPDAAEIYDDDIWNDLYLNGTLDWAYTRINMSASDRQTGLPTGPSKHTTIISASNATLGELYNISVAVDIKQLDDQGSKEMFVFHCVLRATDEAQTVLSIARQIDIQTTIIQWIESMYGSFYPDLYATASQPVKNIELNLQYYLNAMIMVSGMRETIETPNSDIAVGVALRATRIPYWILVVFVLVIVFAASLFGFTILLYLRTKAAAHSHDARNKDGTVVSSREIMENTPLGLADHLAHSAYMSRDSDQIPKAPELKSWVISTTWHGGRRLGIVQQNEVGMVEPARTPSIHPNMNSGMGAPHAQAQETGYFGAQGRKGEYISLNTREVSS